MGRPLLGAARESPAKATTCRIAAGTDSDPEAVQVLVGKWLRRLDAENRAPRFGSAEWLALPPSSTLRTAALVRAAEAWRRHRGSEQVAADLAEQLVAEDRAVVARIRATSYDVAAARDWTTLGPTHGELERLRREAS